MCAHYFFLKQRLRCTDGGLQAATAAGEFRYSHFGQDHDSSTVSVLNRPFATTDPLDGTTGELAICIISALGLDSTSVRCAEEHVTVSFFIMVISFLVTNNAIGYH